MANSSTGRKSRKAEGSVVAPTPVVQIEISETGVTVDGVPVELDSALPRRLWPQAGVHAAAERVAMVLDRPVRAVAKDSSAELRMVVHPDGSTSDVDDGTRAPGLARRGARQAATAVAGVRATTRSALWERRSGSTKGSAEAVPALAGDSTLPKRDRRRRRSVATTSDPQGGVSTEVVGEAAAPAEPSSERSGETARSRGASLVAALSARAATAAAAVSSSAGGVGREMRTRLPVALATATALVLVVALGWVLMTQPFGDGDGQDPSAGVDEGGQQADPGEDQVELEPRTVLAGATIRPVPVRLQVDAQPGEASAVLRVRGAGDSTTVPTWVRVTLYPAGPREQLVRKVRVVGPSTTTVDFPDLTAGQTRWKVEPMARPGRVVKGSTTVLPVPPPEPVAPEVPVDPDVPSTPDVPSSPSNPPPSNPPSNPGGGGGDGGGGNGGGGNGGGGGGGPQDPDDGGPVDPDDR